MSRAIFVSLKATLSELDLGRLDLSNSMLRRATCGWWKLKPANCTAVEYIFGIIKGRAISGYEIAQPDPTLWARIVHNDAIDGRGGGRWFVPVKEPDDELWTATQTIGNIDMRGGSVHYGSVLREGPTFRQVRLDPLNVKPKARSR